MNLEGMYKAVLDGLEEAIFVLDLQMKLAYLNPAAETLTGKMLGEIQGKGCREIFKKLGLNDLPNIEAVLSKRESIKKVLMPVPGGRTVLLTVSPLTENEQITGTVLAVKLQDKSNLDKPLRLDVLNHIFLENADEVTRACIDTSDQKQIDGELWKSDEKYRELVQNANSIIMRRDISGRILFLNPFAQRFFGYGEEIIGKNVVGTIVPEIDSSGRDLAKIIENISKTPEQYATNINENMRSNGERVWIAWTNRPVVNQRGEVEELLCIGNDITDRKLAEESLRSAHQQLLDIIEFLPDATFVVDENKKVIAWNKAIEDMTRLSKDQILGKGDFLYAVPFYGEPRPMLVDLIRKEDKETESRYVFVERKGDRIYAEAYVPSLFGGRGAYLWATASLLFDRQGRLIGSIESIRDITDRRNVEKDLARRDKLLSGVAAAANALLRLPSSDQGIVQSLEILGLSMDVDRVYVAENGRSEKGDHLLSLKFEWSGEGLGPRMGEPAFQNISYENFPNLYKTLSCGDHLRLLIKDLPEDGRAFLEPHGVVSMLIVPIIMEGWFWGFICFEDCHTERDWTSSEIAILTVSAGSIGAAISGRLSEEKLRETRDYLENLLDSANAPIIVWDPSFRITRFNHALERLTGLNSQQVLGKHIGILFPPESKEESLDYIERTLSGERWEAVEIPILRSDGAIRTVLWNSATLFGEDGSTVIATIAQGQDITERKQAEEQVLFQASLLDQVRNAVIATNLEGNIIYWNKFSEALYQWKAEEVLGRNISEIVVDENKIVVMVDVISQLRESGYYEGELPVIKKDGSAFPAHYVFNIIQDVKGLNIGLVGVSVDITERKKVEEDLRTAKERAESATRAKSEFLANMSHEIRTPMNAVIGLTGLLLGTDLTQDQRDYVETIRSSGDALLAVINDILDFSKIEGGKLEIEHQPFDLIDCLESSLDLIEETAAKKGLNVSYFIDSQVPRYLCGDITRLRQVLTNLLSNAVKFTRKGEVKVSVSSNPRDGQIEIRFLVKDTGIGIPKDRMDRLFQSFSQVDASTTRKYGGSGLGLAISKRLVELMGGRIWAESEVGIGSTFCFNILGELSDEPKYDFKAGTAFEKQKDITLSLPKSVEGTSAEKSQPMRILLAEDNMINQKVALRMLERLGYSADAVANGLEVLQALELHPYDIVIMDIQMPEMDGLEATELIRKRPGLSQPYIIAMTAHALKGDRENCFNAGMNDYVSKPVNIMELKRALQRCRDQLKQEPAIDPGVIENLKELQMDGEPDIIEELRGLFMSRAPQRLKTIREALDKKDAETIYKEAHNLKSSSANLGAMKLSGIFNELEMAGRSGVLDRAIELLNQAEAEYERVRAALETEI